MIAFFEVSVPRNQNHSRLKKENKEEADKQNQRTRANKLAAEWMNKWDRDGDSQVQRNEVGESFRRFAFAVIDRNQDQQISLQETASYISESLTEDKKREDLRRLLDQLK